MALKNWCKGLIKERFFHLSTWRIFTTNFFCDDCLKRSCKLLEQVFKGNFSENSRFLIDFFWIFTFFCTIWFKSELELTERIRLLNRNKALRLS